jgi:hypothetical protein
MKRDMGLVRRLVLAIEGSATGAPPGALEIPGYTPEQVAYHMRLMLESGMVTRLDGAAAGLVSLTWQGHEFADAARDDLRWGRAMRIVQDKGGAVSADVLQQLLTALMKGTLGLA